MDGMAKDDQEDSEGVYDDEGREEMMRNDEISPEEEAFMQGYEDIDEEEKSDGGDDAYEKSFEEKPRKARRR